MIYLDNAATTRVSEIAAQAALSVMRECFGNPSSLHGLGLKAEEMLDAARRQIAKRIGAEAQEITFTSGGSEGNNLAILGGARARRRKGKHIITTAIEHASVLECMRRLEEDGFEVTRLLPNADGIITAEQVVEALREDTVLVSVMAVNNEIGSVLPIEQIARAVHRKSPQVLVHTDAVQAFCKIPLAVKKLDVDLLTMSGHKIHAPKGVGALFVKKGVRIAPHLLGGGQEKGLRSGTENVPGICAFGAASEQMIDCGKLKAYLTEKLEALSCVKLLAHTAAPHILSVAVLGFPSEVAMRILEEEEIYVSSGSACSRGHRSYVLEAIGVPSELIDSAIRISLSSDITKEEIDRVCDVISTRFGRK
ncbi:MAG: cysteine desulfurase [Oscillospiraceae bacterium]|nr:cysteine desulfurase [Oscillospiraceae bacterium]